MPKRGRPKGSKTKGKPVPPSVRQAPVVRVCLGPSARPHSFVSTDPSNRVCPRCREKQKALGRLFVEPPVSTEGL